MSRARPAPLSGRIRTRPAARRGQAQLATRGERYAQYGLLVGLFCGPRPFSALQAGRPHPSMVTLMISTHLTEVYHSFTKHWAIVRRYISDEACSSSGRSSLKIHIVEIIEHLQGLCKGVYICTQNTRPKGAKGSSPNSTVLFHTSPHLASPLPDELFHVWQTYLARSLQAPLSPFTLPLSQRLRLYVSFSPHSRLGYFC